MKSILTLCIAHLLVALIAPTLVDGEFAAMFNFNSCAPEAGKVCNGTEWALIETTIAIAAGIPQRRSLRLGQTGRSLKTCPTGCGPYCVVGGTGCIKPGRRRLFHDAAPRTMNDEHLEASATGHRQLGNAMAILQLGNAMAILQLGNAMAILPPLQLPWTC
jgi:hypothetical protein